MKGVRGEGAFDVLVKARALEAQGKSIIHMEIGEPDFPTPPNVIEAGKKALDSGFTKYGPTQGDPVLREAIAAHLAETRGIPADASRVVVTPGAKPVLFYTMLTLLEPGDEAMYPNPGFPIYESVIHHTGAKAVAMPLVEDRGFSIDLDKFRDNLTDRTKLIILCSPQNPTGGSIPEADLRAIAEMVKDRDLLVLTDEVYSRIWFDEKPFSISSVDGMAEKTIVLDGFSKTYSMTGWRIGYGLMPEWLVAPVCLMMVNSASHTASFTQRAALEALTGPAGFGRDDGQGIQPPPESHRGGAERHIRVQLHQPGRRLLRLPPTSRGRASTRRNSPTAFSTRPAWPASKAIPSASTAKAICALATPLPTNRLRKRWTASQG